VTRPRLGLDTATSYLAVALWWPGDGHVARAAWPLGRLVAAELVPRVDRFLASAGIGPGDLGGVGVGTGPGSYTGARVGVAWALAVGRALAVPVVGGDSLAARALATVEPGAVRWVAVEARRGEAWLQRWGWSAGVLVPLGDRRTASLADLPDEAAASLGQAPDALWHAQAVDAPDPAPPRVRYGA
jgi:tRNA threonylcarbamoyladenosine biosynthesis protein TsaB